MAQTAGSMAPAGWARAHPRDAAAPHLRQATPARSGTVPPAGGTDAALQERGVPEQGLPEQGLPERVLIISDAWAPQVNGVARSYEHITRVLRAQGRRVEVIGPAAFATLPMPGYDEIPLALAPARRLAAMIDGFAPQAVHIAVEGPLGWAARRHCLRRGMAFSTAFHTNFPAYAALRAPRPLAPAVARTVMGVARRFHAAARLTYVATPSLEAQLRGWGFDGRLVRLSRGVDCALFRPGPERPAADPPVLLYVGRVAPEKSVEAFLALPPSATGPVRKVVVGDGPLLPALRRRHPEVAFHGTLTGPALAQAYRDADVFVFPSRTDTFGIVLIEALASGLAVAAHDVPGPRDIVTDPRLGALDADLGRAIRRALAAPGRRADRHAHVRDHYSWDAVADTFLAHSAEVAR